MFHVEHRTLTQINQQRECLCCGAVESASSLLKRGIMGTWHRISPKHLASYLEEMEFRFNRRKRPDLFIDTLRHMVTAPVLNELIPRVRRQFLPHFHRTRIPF